MLLREHGVTFSEEGIRVGRASLKRWMLEKGPQGQEDKKLFLCGVEKAEEEHSFKMERVLIMSLLQVSRRKGLK